MASKNRFPPATSLATKKVMRANRGKDTQPELRVRRIVHASGLRYRVDYRPEESLNRRGDLVFIRSKVVVFIHGCFWHGCPKHYRKPTSNQDYWDQKIARNCQRDKAITTALRNNRWIVVRIWEHEVSNPKAIGRKMARIKKLIHNRKS